MVAITAAGILVLGFVGALVARGSTRINRDAKLLIQGCVAVVSLRKTECSLSQPGDVANWPECDVRACSEIVWLSGSTWRWLAQGLNARLTQGGALWAARSRCKV